MANLVREIDQLPQLRWEQREFRYDLILQASLQITGAVADCLSHAEQSEDLRQWIIEIGKRALQEYIALGEYIDGDWLESLMNVGGAVDTGRYFPAVPVPSILHRSYGKTWLRLLKSEFVPLPRTPSGKFHATDEIEEDVLQPKSMG